MSYEVNCEPDLEQPTRRVFNSRVFSYTFTKPVPECPCCQDTGEVSSTRWLADGSFYTEGAFCSCPAGRTKLNQVAPWPVTEPIGLFDDPIRIECNKCHGKGWWWGDYCECQAGRDMRREYIGYDTGDDIHP